MGDLDKSVAYLYNPRYAKAMGITVANPPNASSKKDLHMEADPVRKEKVSLQKHISKIKDIILKNPYKHIVNNYQPEVIPGSIFDSQSNSAKSQAFENQEYENEWES